MWVWGIKNELERSAIASLEKESDRGAAILAAIFLKIAWNWKFDHVFATTKPLPNWQVSYSDRAVPSEILGQWSNLHFSCAYSASLSSTR